MTLFGASVCILGEFHTSGWVSGELGRVSLVDLATLIVKLQPLSITKASACQMSMLKPSRGKPCFYKLSLGDRPIGGISYGFYDPFLSSAFSEEAGPFEAQRLSLVRTQFGLVFLRFPS